MAEIIRDTLLSDVKFWLLSSNSLTDENLTKLNEIVITKVGDDDTLYPEVLFKCLEIAANKNRGDYSTNLTTNVKQEKLGPLELQYYSASTKNPWPSWIKFELPVIASDIGYTISSKKYFDIVISPGDTIDIFDGQLDSIT